MERDITIRRARPQDTEAMLTITRDVWDGHDYLPRVWPSWLADHAGILLAAEAGGDVLGIQHVDVQPDGSAWLEGIRVLEAAQGRGVATRLLKAGIDWARFTGLTSARLSTSTDNPASNRLAERAGMNTVARFASVRLSRSSEPSPATARVGRPDEVAAVRRALEGWGGAAFYTEGWTGYRLTDDRLRVLLAMSQVIVNGDGHFDGVAIATSSVERRHPRAGLLRGTAAGTRAVLAYLRQSLASLGVPSSRSQLELSDDRWKDLAEQGLERAWEHDMRLWELDLT